MINNYCLLAFILILSQNLICFNTYGAPVAYTKSDPLTPLDPMGNHISNHLEPLSKTNGTPQQRVRNGNFSSRVLDTYKRNLDEAMGKKTSTQIKPTTITIDPSIVTTTTGTTKSTPNEKIKKTSSEKTLKSDSSKNIKKTETSSLTTTTNPTDQKIEKKAEDQKTINTENTQDNKIEKKEDNKTVEKNNAKKDDNTTLYEPKDTQKVAKKDARKQAYDGARPQLWYGGPWKRG